MPDSVTDGDHHPPVGKREAVVPVPADRRQRHGRAVAPVKDELPVSRKLRQQHRLNLAERFRLRLDAVLESRSHVSLDAVAFGDVEDRHADAGNGTVGTSHREVVGDELASDGIGEHLLHRRRVDGTTGVDQRVDDRRLDLDTAGPATVDSSVAVHLHAATSTPKRLGLDTCQHRRGGSPSQTPVARSSRSGEPLGLST